MELFCKNITDYWDANTNAISEFGAYLRALSPEEQKIALSSLRKAITKHARVLSDTDLLRVGWILADDLYKSIWITRFFDNAIYLYLTATASRFLSILQKRGYALQFIVDNSFPQNLEGYHGLLDVLHPIFSAAGFVYICPQTIALKLMHSDGITRDNYFNELPRYINEARSIMQSILDACYLDKRHFILIDADFNIDLLNAILGAEKMPGILLAFRNLPPEKGTKISISYPTQPFDTHLT